MITKFMVIEKHLTESKMGGFIKDYKDPVLIKNENLA